MFLVVLGLSAALHGLVLFGAARNGLRAPSPVLENRPVSTVRIIRTRTAPQKSVPPKPTEQKKVVEKAIEPEPEPKPIPEAEYIENAVERTAETSEQAYYGTAETEDGGAVTTNDYEELLAYIRDFINKNLAYPPIARQRNIQGVVGVSLEIEKNGELVSITVNHSSGSSMLDNAALSLIKKIHPFRNITIKSKLALNINVDYKLTE